MTDREKTSIPRKDFSTPVRKALETSLINTSMTVHDFGCGSLANQEKHGNDVTRLRNIGYDVTGHDIHHGKKRIADVVFCSFVINVIECPIDRANLIRDAYNHAKKMLILSARSDSKSLEKSKVSEMNDGVVTCKNTFQKFYTTKELQAYVMEVLSKDSKVLRDGSVIITK